MRMRVHEGAHSLWCTYGLTRGGSVPTNRVGLRDQTHVFRLGGNALSHSRVMSPACSVVLGKPLFKSLPRFTWQKASAGGNILAARSPFPFSSMLFALSKNIRTFLSRRRGVSHKSCSGMKK